MTTKTIPVALQLYSVREPCDVDLADVLKQVASWGFDGVEFAGFHEHDAADVKRMLDDADLRCCGSHARVEWFEDRFDWMLETHRTIACDWLIIPYLPPGRRDSRDTCLRTAKQLTAWAQQVESEGMRAGYHAHDGDMKPLEGGKSAWQLIAEHTPDTFIMQYDTANGMAGGADPVAPLRQFPGRGQSTHLKAYSKTDGHGTTLIGEGDVPWHDVLDACESVAGTDWYVIEQEGHPTLSPLAAAQASLEGFRRIAGT